MFFLRFHFLQIHKAHWMELHDTPLCVRKWVNPSIKDYERKGRERTWEKIDQLTG